MTLTHHHINILNNKPIKKKNPSHAVQDGSFKANQNSDHWNQQKVDTVKKIKIPRSQGSCNQCISNKKKRKERRKIKKTELKTVELIFSERYGVANQWAKAFSQGEW